MLRSLSTTELMVEASRKIHEIVGVLSLLDVGIHHAGNSMMELKNASLRTSAASSGSKLVMVPSGLMKLTSFQTVLAGHFTHQTKLIPTLFGSIQTPPAPCP